MFIHAFTDGRDTSPRLDRATCRTCSGSCRPRVWGNVATVSGRYYAMDRDTRWNRVKLAYDALVGNKGPHAPDALTAIKRAYAADETDEFITPTVIGAVSGSRISSG